MLAIPKRNAPGGDFTQFLVFLIFEGQPCPILEPFPGPNLRFEVHLRWKIAAGDAAEFHSELERRVFDSFGFPLDIEADS